MPAADPMSRGKPRNFKKRLQSEDELDHQQVLPSQVIDPAELLSLLDDLVEQGGNLTLGRVKRGGAITVRVFLGVPSKAVYLAHSGEWREWLASLDD